MKTGFMLGPVLLAVSIGLLWLFKTGFFASKKVHFHAGFMVIKKNQPLDFSDSKYMDFEPCTVNGQAIEHSSEDDQKEKAHLHDQVGDVVHVHREGATWRDLFTNIKYSLDSKNSGAFLNGKKVVNFYDLQIKPYDSLVVFLDGTSVQEFLPRAVTKEHIQEIEKKSETCGS